MAWITLKCYSNKKEFNKLTTVDIFLFPKVARTRHLYSVGSAGCWRPSLGFGLLRPSSEPKRTSYEHSYFSLSNKLCYIYVVSVKNKLFINLEINFDISLQDRFLTSNSAVKNLPYNEIPVVGP